MLIVKAGEVIGITLLVRVVKTPIDPVRDTPVGTTLAAAVALTTPIPTVSAGLLIDKLASPTTTVVPITPVESTPVGTTLAAAVTVTVLVDAVADTPVMAVLASATTTTDQH